MRQWTMKIYSEMDSMLVAVELKIKRVFEVAIFTSSQTYFAVTIDRIDDIVNLQYVFSYSMVFYQSQYPILSY